MSTLLQTFSKLTGIENSTAQSLCFIRKQKGRQIILQCIHDNMDNNMTKKKIQGNMYNIETYKLALRTSKQYG